MSRRRPVGLVVVPLLGALALAAGAAIWITTPVSFGWFAYAPLTDVQFQPGLLTRLQVGPILLAVGIALLAGWVGFLLGRRRRGRFDRERSV